MNQKILTYREVLTVPLGENGESLVDVCTYDSDIIAKYEQTDMFPYTGERIFVRDAVARKLAAISTNLFKKGGFRLRIVYGYRHPNVQRKYFERERSALKLKHGDFSDDALDEATHLLIAVPEVAGHPTGGAIDLEIVDKSGNSLDFGTRIADFSRPEKLPTFAEGLTQEQISNRLLLRDSMLREGFAPFNGEWWHFSYGDREWACYYDRSSSLYSAVEFRDD